MLHQWRTPTASRAITTQAITMNRVTTTMARTRAWSLTYLRLTRRTRRTVPVAATMGTATITARMTPSHKNDAVVGL
jgi:hypothetical protein